MEGGGGEGDYYTYRYTVTARMTPALRRAVTRAILMFHWLWGTKSHDSVHRAQFLKRKEPKRIRTVVPLPTSLTPYRKAKPAHWGCAGQCPHAWCNLCASGSTVRITNTSCCWSVATRSLGAEKSPQRTYSPPSPTHPFPPPTPFPVQSTPRCWSAAPKRGLARVRGPRPEKRH